ncbi:MAG TPA: TetR/AcrR family transcriptional regulator [Solirubrobacteraceae bacterium]|nr:TetR/AcrR family transcriptional regulator [Solirubrobacteraceae bacterium]
MPALGRDPSLRQRRAAVEARVLGAAREMLEEGDSLGGLSVERIAQRAGISRPAFYDYFRDKRDLLVRLVEEAVGPVLREADEEAGGRPSGPDEIPHTIRAAMAFARENASVFRATVEASAYDPVVRGLWRDRILGRFVAVIERRIRAQVARGAALPLDPRAAAIALVAMVEHSLYHHVSADDGVADEQLVETLVTIAVRAVYGPTAPA